MHFEFDEKVIMGDLFVVPATMADSAPTPEQRSR